MLNFLVHRFDVGTVAPTPLSRATFLLAFRNRDDTVKFMEINALTARLMQLLGEDANSSGAKLLTQIAGELNHPLPQAIVEAGAGILADLRERDILLGTRRILL